MLDSKPTEAPPLPNLPVSAPLVTIHAGALPSLNQILELVVYRPLAAVKIIKEERRKGRELAAQWARSKGLRLERKVIIDRKAKGVRGEIVERLVEPVTIRPVFILVSIYRKRSKGDASKADRIRDTYNPSLKGIVDGFIDANLLPGDSELVIPDYWLHYAGLEDQHRTEINLYEL